MSTKNDNKKKNRTHLSKYLRNCYGINSRVSGCGRPIEYKVLFDPDKGIEGISYLPTGTKPEGNVTPFNIGCNCDGACAIKQIIIDGNDTVVLFADGDRVCVTRHVDDREDHVSAVLWALGKKVFGEKLAPQINKALKRHAVTIEELRKEKAERKAEEKRRKDEANKTPING